MEKRGRTAIFFGLVGSGTQNRRDKMVVEIDHPEIGKYEALGNPVKSSVMEDGKFEPPPLLGQHTEEVFSSPLGMSAEDVQALRDEGVV